jgi:hypothetical protein
LKKTGWFKKCDFQLLVGIFPRWDFQSAPPFKHNKQRSFLYWYAYL